MEEVRSEGRFSRRHGGGIGTVSGLSGRMGPGITEASVKRWKKFSPIFADIGGWIWQNRPTKTNFTLRPGDRKRRIMTEISVKPQMNINTSRCIICMSFVVNAFSLSVE